MEVTRGRPPPRSFWEAGGGCSSSDVQSEWGCQGRGLGPQGRRGAPLEVGRWAESRRDAAAWAPSAPPLPGHSGRRRLACPVRDPRGPAGLSILLLRYSAVSSGPPVHPSGQAGPLQGRYGPSPLPWTLCGCPLPWRPGDGPQPSPASSGDTCLCLLLPWACHSLSSTSLSAQRPVPHRLRPKCLPSGTWPPVGAQPLPTHPSRPSVLGLSSERRAARL